MIEPSLYGGNNYVNFTVPSYFTSPTKVVFGWYAESGNYSGESKLHSPARLPEVAVAPVSFRSPTTG